ncbi:sodium/glutamate symporter [Peptoniphilus lacydonensis]|uniref:sodium/glutamate symporter n=1 Tax=Peptoniphilus lacydonensis TaxID=1673725 RepID=UPI0029080FB3|nr:sodium/glutamate symporter [Peptoniphilus lacydonensis]MBS6610677.1 sodium/glutamate symporter [Peptoniphilus harei]MDU5376908.1 sodium/glutamate symporter [Peptoniphilus lacydonensis]MDU5436319.1 sodium/glutamate symporter [Peptoniphilus lacydonensis]
MTIEMDMIQTIGLAVILLLIGRYLRSKIYFFQKFAIPAAVIGGFLFAIIHLILRLTNTAAFEFDTTLQSFFMTIFFTSIGFGASIKILKIGGPKVIKFLLLASLLCVLQNFLAVGLARPVGVEPGLALMTGSTPMTGGHGTSAGIAPLVEASGVVGAETVAYSAATFGLVVGSLMGGPLANKLILKNNLLEKKKNEEEVVVDESILKEEEKVLDGKKIQLGFFAILVAMGIGVYISKFFNGQIAKLTDKAALPIYIGPMLLGILFRYISDRGSNFLPNEEISIAGELGLNLFLSMALMTLKLWELVELAVPMLILLLAQTILMALFAYFVTYKVMGNNYDSAVIAGGHCGFGMGATPNGVANMESICDKFVYSKMAFFVLPIVGGMFIDFTNVLIITIFLGIFA